MMFWKNITRKTKVLIIVITGLVLFTGAYLIPKIAVPSVDSAANVYIEDVVGNKDDTSGGTSIVALIKSVGGGTNSHLPLFTGNIYYVDAAQADDTGDGLTPTTAKKTIGAAIDLTSNGDRITVKAGAYDENGLDLDNDGLELVCEIGTEILDTTTGTQSLLVSGDNCSIVGVHVSQAGQIGIKVTGAECLLDNVVVHASTTAFDIDGNSTILFTCAASNYSVTGFDYSGSYCLAKTLAATGASGSTRGFYLSANTADYNTFNDCISVGNGTSSYHIVTGCAGNIFKQSASGGGDGRWIDADEVNVFADFTFASFIEKALTLTANGSTVSANLYVITGTVKINSIIGVVEVALTGSNEDCFLDVYSTNGNTPISKNTTLDIGASLKGATMARLDKADKVLTYANANAPFLLDEIDTKKEGFRLGEDRTGGVHVATYLRFIYTDAGGGDASSGEIHWYVDWEPVSDDGWLAPA